jgi:hypothetical protein
MLLAVLLILVSIDMMMLLMLLKSTAPLYCTTTDVRTQNWTLSRKG